MNANTDFARLLAKYFTSWLIGQRQVSPHTVASYRDTFRLLALYAKNVLKISPQDLTFDDLDVEFLVAFLNHLEHQRGNCARSRNARLAAIRAFFRYVALQEPRYAMLAQQVLSMPSKRHDRKSVDFLDYDQIEALLQATDPNTRIGRRDHCLLLIAVKRVCAHRKSSHCVAKTYTWTAALTRDASEKGARHDAFLCEKIHSPRSKSGSRNALGNRAIRFFSTSAGAHLPMTALIICSKRTWLSHGINAPLCVINGSRRTHSDTQRRWSFCETVSIGPRLHCGSDTSR